MIRILKILYMKVMNKHIIFIKIIINFTYVNPCSFFLEKFSTSIKRTHIGDIHPFPQLKAKLYTILFTCTCGKLKSRNTLQIQYAYATTEFVNRSYPHIFFGLIRFSVRPPITFKGGVICIR